MWVPVQQRDRRHDLRAEEDTGEMQRKVFVDLTKAFDTVSRDGLWKILARLCCPPKFLTLLRQLNEGQ